MALIIERTNPRTGHYRESGHQEWMDMFMPLFSYKPTVAFARLFASLIALATSPKAGTFKRKRYDRVNFGWEERE